MSNFEWFERQITLDFVLLNILKFVCDYFKEDYLQNFAQPFKYCVSKPLAMKQNYSPFK